MAKEQFDFEELKALKFNDYKKTYCKPAKLKKAKGCLLMEFSLQGRKKKPVLLTFNKLEQARLAFFVLKAAKSTDLKKAYKSVVLAKVTSTKGDDGRLNLTLDIVKSKLSASAIQEDENNVAFFNQLDIVLNVIGVSEDSEEVNSESSSDTVVDESTIQELRQEFQEAQHLYKQSKTLDKAAKAEAIKEVSSMFKTLMPKLEHFISISDKKQQLQTATKIKENIEKFQSALGATATKGTAKDTAKGTAKSNSKLEALTGGISKKAAQLLKDYQSEIDSIDGLADKLRSISQLA